jgi:anti-sigma-K factor RskA
MHRVIRDHLEQVLADSHAAPSGGENTQVSRDYQLHLEQCDGCRGEIEAMRGHSMALRQLRSDAEPRPGFYARVMDRIEAQRARSIWSIFSESPFGRNLAVASMAVAVLLGVFLLTSEQFTDQNANQPVQIISATLPGEDQPASNVRFVPGSSAVPDRDAVLVNLVTYRGQ